MSTRDIHPIIRQIIDRDCHVGEGDRTVVRHVISKLKHGYETLRQMSTRDRRLLIEQAICHHRANQRLYVEVMNGFSSCRRIERQLRKQFESISAGELHNLMRENSVSPAYLAFRLGWSHGRVQQAMQAGLSRPRQIEQWLTAIAKAENSDVPVKSLIQDESHAAECNFCGCPLVVGDKVFVYQNHVYCSTNCCRKSCGW